MVSAIKHYEGMFLVDNKFAAKNWNDEEIQLGHLLTKHGGEAIRGRCWAERKLAYEIGKHKRAVYYLVFFKMPPENVSALRHDLELAENVIRSMILVHEDDQVERVLAREDADAQRQATEGASRSSDGPPREERRVEEVPDFPHEEISLP